MENINSGIDGYENTATQWSERLTALAHPARLEILRYLGDRENCCCKDVVARLPLAQSTVSQHLKVLVAAGLVDCENQAQRSCYSLNKEALEAISAAVQDLAGTCCNTGNCHKTPEEKSSQ